MKKLCTLLVIIACLTEAKAQYVNIPGPYFAAWLQTKFPTAMNGNQLDTTDVTITTRVSIVFDNVVDDITGIRYFDNLDTLDCTSKGLSSLATLPPNLKYLKCNLNSLTSLPALPVTLQSLYCAGNQLTGLPTLPNSLQVLFCGDNQIPSIPSLPTSIYSLECVQNQLSVLPSLPNNLELLYCGSNSLTVLPTLPTALRVLGCENNLLTALPVLPAGLQGLTCNHNQISALPALTNSLGTLECSNNQLTSLPPLPNNLLFLSCGFNQLTSLPALPASLEGLYCNNNNISCFNMFSNAYNWFDISNNLNTCVPNYISVMDSATLNFPLCLPGNINGCINSEGIAGYVYKDNDANCLKNTGDGSLKNIPLKMYDMTGNVLSQHLSAINGAYQFTQSSDTYSISIDTTGLPFTTSCNFPGLDTTITVITLDTNVNFALTCKTGIDVGIQSIITSGIIFPGQTHTLTINAGDISHWYNLNCGAGSSGTVSFSISGPVTYVGTAPGSLAPSISGNIYTYTIPDFASINNTQDFKLLFQTNTNATPGDAICVTATVNPIAGDLNPSNNNYSYCYTVVNSYDPNIKEVYPIDVMPGFNDWLTYTIHFQNTGTAPAFNIRLNDTLDNMLNLETFQVLNYSHQNNTTLNGRTLNVYFPNILLPDSTSDLTGSMGYIQYRVKPKLGWVSPYKIKNTAYIYFDYNTPVITNTTYNSFLLPTGLTDKNEVLATLYPNPTNGTFTIELNTKEKLVVKLLDVTGNMVLLQTFENGKTMIDGSHLAAGIYNINIIGNNSIANKKLVIVK